MFKYLISLTALLLATVPAAVNAETSILNVSYDVSREYYKDLNAAFIAYWKEKTGETVTVNQSHGGSTKQARSVAEGLQADVITMNRALDIDILYEKAKLIPREWQSRLPNSSVPSASTPVFLVRKGNPKQIKDWNDLVRPNVSVVIPNPKTSGNGKYTYLAAWGYVIKNGGDEVKAKDFVTKLFKNVPVLDSGGRGATTTFIQRDIGDALVTFENEVFLIHKELGADKFEIVYPSISVLAENPVTLVDKVVDKRKSRDLAQAYLEFHFSEKGQQIAAQHYLRPQANANQDQFVRVFKPLDLFKVESIFGSWSKAEKIHFSDGGLFDQIYAR